MLGTVKLMNRIKEAPAHSLIIESARQLDLEEKEAVAHHSSHSNNALLSDSQFGAYKSMEE